MVYASVPFARELQPSCPCLTRASTFLQPKKRNVSHFVAAAQKQERKTWIPATSAGMTRDILVLYTVIDPRIDFETREV
jgi:hypothetical protein